MSGLNSLFTLLRNTPEGSFFNPWYQHDEKHDLSEEGPEIRRRQLRAYLSERIGRAKYLFIAEALGYQGGHFTGIAMTSERILLGHHEPVHGIPADGAFQSAPAQRTSKPAVNAKGMSEPTATIMWKALYKLGIDPYETVLWNALPWHPYDPDEGLLSNRTPTDRELHQGYPSLKAFLALFPGAQPIAVGRKCEQSLTDFDLPYIPVRHPANGGAPKFRRQMRELMEN
ncbi:Uracil DNA glycosylase superfamily protein [Fodinibius roseus]|uniref:Uracil DNA glycosylase superfamily protein n=1 Tax=Fodinibius roseus TaxID=1194090 RepID=A0A1M5H8L3_9BACT|nr:uracil-DNA glycosylase [Fodinibius roseus]SHG12304.1 Uracil DNA glycosylase superfamily protein [Fodinibius roseus]